jgi:hypothetical protein
MTKELLYQQYVIERKSLLEISRINDINRKKLKLLFDEWNIKNLNLSYEKDFLYQKYIVENLSIESISKLLCCNRNLVSKLIKENNLKKDIDHIKICRENTTFLRYGCKHSTQNNVIVLKTITTNLSKYGVENVSQDASVKFKKNEKFKKKHISGNCKTLKEKNIKLAKKLEPKFKKYFGKSIRQISIENNIPQITLNRYLKRNPQTSELELNTFLSGYKKSLTDIEQIISKNCSFERWNKSPCENLRFRPDFKLNDFIFLNVDGLYWHSEKEKDKKYHFTMRNLFEINKLRIFQFRSNEVFNNFEIIKSILNNNLKKNHYKLGARKTKINTVTFANAKEFLNVNHIKGFKKARHIGLYYKDELVSIMSYKIFKDKIKIERFCSKINHNVMGAFSKLLKQIKKDLSHLPIHYWVDLRYGTGEFLIKQGFKLEKETLGWEWTDYFNTYNRLPCRANMDERKLTEREHAKELGWAKIYDAGQRLFVLKAFSQNK